jgi:serine/threonine protein kinase
MSSAGGTLVGLRRVGRRALAGAQGLLAAPSALCGSPAYMAPEVVAADAAHLASRRFAAFDGRRADVWSGGVLLAEAAFGGPLFRPPAKALDPLAEVAALHGAWVRAGYLP